MQRQQSFTRVMPAGNGKLALDAAAGVPHAQRRCNPMPAIYCYLRAAII